MQKNKINKIARDVVQYEINALKKLKDYEDKLTLEYDQLVKELKNE